MHRLGKGKAAKKATREMPEEDPEFQIAPMIDILLVLLVFFMAISSTEVLQTNDKVQLPVAKEGKEAPKGIEGGMLIINVLWNPLNNVGSLDVEGKPYAVASDIVPILQHTVQVTPDCRIVIRADKAVRYDYLRSVLKTAANAGVNNVTFSVVDKDPNQPIKN
jgi:biopolymer transport protein ExbD